MSKINDLIKELCPNGVEYKQLREISNMQRGQSITSKDLMNGTIPVVAGGQEPSFYNNKFNRTGETITVSSSGAYAGHINYWNEPILCTDSFSIKSDTMNVRYLYHYLKLKQQYIYEKKKGAGIPHVHISDIDKMLVPTPPLEIQEEIVKILDKFSGLEAELKEELEARKSQYKFLCKKMITNDLFNETKLGDIALIKTGSKPKDIFEEGNFEYINAGTTNSGYVDTINANGDCVTTPSRGQGGIGYVGYQKNNFWCGPLCYQIRSKNTNILNKYLYYYMLTNKNYILSLKHEGGVPAVNIKELQDMPIFYPSIEEQERIVNILDKFEKLINEIIPTEINLRRKQYEYYRNKLLSFEELKEND